MSFATYKDPPGNASAGPRNRWPFWGESYLEKNRWPIDIGAGLAESDWKSPESTSRNLSNLDLLTGRSYYAVNYWHQERTRLIGKMSLVDG